MRSRLQARLARLPVRVRVTVAFTAAMAALLAAAGLFLYLRLGSTLQDAVDRGLRDRAADLQVLVREADAFAPGRGPLTAQGEGLAQLISRDGRVVDAPPSLRSRSLLTAAELRRAARGRVLVTHDHSPVPSQDVRVLAEPARAGGRTLVLAVAASLDPSDEAQHEFGGLLLIGGPVALLIAALAGFAAAAGALRPVELMRRRAGEIQAARPGMRLPVPPSDDELSRLGETLNAMLDRLEEAFARERAFVSDASHELRMPLAILKGELELAMRDARDVETFRAAVASATEETDRLVQLAEDLLVLARSDADGLAARTADVRAAGLLDAVARRFARPAAERGAVLETAAPEDLVVPADGLRLEQALGNLVENSLHHGARRVRLTVGVAGERVALHVLDDGVGFPPGFIDRAFDRFTRADPARGRGGAGLGLSIVAAIAAAHGGSVGARNRPEGGADVWLELPRR